MKKPRNMDVSMLKLPRLTPAQAEAQDFTSITTDISPEMEAHVIRAMDSTLATCRACWIVFPDGSWQAARNKSDMTGLLKALGFIPTGPNQKKVLPPKPALSLSPE